MNEYVGADALHPPAMSRFYRDDVGIVPYKKMHNLSYKSQFIAVKEYFVIHKKRRSIMIKKHVSMILAIFMLMQLFVLPTSASTWGLYQDTNGLTRDSLLKVPMGSENLLVDNLSLPKTGAGGGSITWTASPEGIISADGRLTRPQATTDVILTADIKNGSNTGSKNFTFTVPGEEAWAYGLPQPAGTFFYDDFEDGNINSRIVTTPGEGSVTEANGVLNFKKTSASGTTAATIHMKEDKSALTGRFVTEFILTRPSGKMISAQFTGDGGLVGVVTWWGTGDNIVNVEYADEPDGGRQNHFFELAEVNATKTLKVTLYYDTEAGTVSYWLNNIPAGSGYSCGAVNQKYVYLYNGNSTMDANMDDLRMYYAQSGDESSVDADLLALEDVFAGSLFNGSLYKSVSLPTKGLHGSKITWATSDSAIMATDGTLNRPTDSAYSLDPSVTLTATVSSGTITKTKEFTFTVMRLESGDKKIAESDARALALNNMISPTELVEGYIKYHLTLPSEGAFGSTITWTSSAPAYISNAGKIMQYPATGDASPEVAMKASVTFGTATVTRNIYVRVLPQEVGSLQNAIPAVHETFHQDSFDDDGNSVRYNWSLRPYGEGVAEPRNGKMQISRTVNQGSNYITHVEMSAHDSRLEQEGLVVFDFNWSKEKTGATYFLASAESGAVTKVTWNSDNTFSITYKETAEGETKTLNTVAFDGTVRVRARINTSRNTFTLWLNETVMVSNGRPATAQKAALKTLFWGITDDNFIDTYIDDLHCYFAKPYAYEQPGYDADWLTEETLGASFIMPYTIDSDLHLPTVGKYGSTISWSSSHPDVIDPATGKVTRPASGAAMPFVTLKATITVGNYGAAKDFSFYVMPVYSGATQVQLDMDYLTLKNYNILSFDDKATDAVRYSLRLPSRLAYGSDIMWSSSDESAITSSGRVIRPRWDMPEKQVTLTATVSSGDAEQTKTFDFTVKPDEELKDPNYMPDEEFFGKWNGTSWEQEGKFDYSADAGMQDIEAAAKAGNYEAAKEALLAYLQARPLDAMTENFAVTRDKAYVDNLALNDVFHYQSSRWLMGYGTISNHELQQVEIPLHSLATIGTKASYNIEAKYNEATALTIASKEHPNAAYRPKLKVVSGGKTYTYDVLADATSRAGQYAHNNYGTEAYLKVQFFGGLHSDETYISTLMFDSTGVPGGVTSASLILTVKLDEPYAKSKDITIFEEPNVGWTDTTLTYAYTPKFYYNVNGVPGGMNWADIYPQYCDSEFQQTHRFQNLGNVLAEYEATQDEAYAYKILHTMMDYIIDCQFTMSLKQAWDYNGGYFWSDYWELDQANGGTTKRRGGMPQLLTTSFRLTNWIPIYERLLHSEYMTPDVCTTILKNLWDCANEGDTYLLDYALQQTPRANNQWVFEANNITKVALCFPEFANYDKWLGDMTDVLNHVKRGGYGKDGAYGEAVQGYSESVLNQYLEYAIMMKQAGKELPEGYDEFLYNATIYCMMISKDSAGVAMSWGDAGYSQNYSRRMPLYEQLNPEPNYMYISTWGQEGTEPDWTSINFPSMNVSIMQSDWSKSALHAFTDNNGVGGHGHPDDNALRVSAYGAYLLVDPGVFSYDDTIYRKYGISTRAHNTVEVDNTSQNMLQDAFIVDEADLPGWTDEWSTNSQFDVLSQTSESYDEVDHRRTTTFLKSGFFIVSDLMQPKDEKAHSYKQLWHYMPQTGVYANAATGNMGTNRPGVNITVSSPDGTATNSPAYNAQYPTPEMGWFSSRWGTASYAPYTYYAKDNVVGKTGFDTLLFPHNGQTLTAATTEDIDLGVPVEVATAMKMTTTLDGVTSKTSYMLEYNPTAGVIRTFGDYKGDGMVNVVRTDTQGMVQELILNKGTALQKADGTKLLDTNGKLANIGLTVEGTKAIITTGDSQATGKVELSPQDITFAAASNLQYVCVDGTYYKFKEENGVVVLGEETTGDKPGAMTADLSKVTRQSLLKVPSDDATLLDNLNLSVPGVIFTSSDAAVINPETGVVTRPAQTKNVVLTATVGEETKDFIFRVPGKFDAVGGEKSVPPMKEIIYQNDFNSAEKDSRITGGAVQENGALHLTGGASGSVSASILLSDANEPLSGQFVVEYLLKRKDMYTPFYAYAFGTPNRFMEHGSEGGNVVVSDQSGQTTVNAWDSKGGIHNMGEGHVKTTIYFDTDKGTYDLWFNNIYVKSGYTAGPDNIKEVAFQTGSKGVSDFTIDDLIVYRAEIPGEVKLYDDFGDGVLADTIEKTANSAEVMESGGRLDIAGTATGGNSSAVLYLNEAKEAMTGKFTVSFAASRTEVSAWPASVKQFDFYDETGKAILSIRWGQNKGLTVSVKDENGVAQDVSVSANATNFVNIALTFDTDKQTVEIYVDGVKMPVGDKDYGYFKNDVHNVKKLQTLSWGGDAGMHYLQVVDNRGTQVEYQQPSFTEMPTSHIHAKGDGGAAYDGAGAIKMGNGYFWLNLKEDGSNITGNVTLEFEMTRYYSSNCSFDILDAAENKLAGGIWYVNANGITAVAGDGSGTSSQSYYDGNAKVKVIYNHGSKKISMYIDDVLAASGTVPESAGGIAILRIYNNGGGGTDELYVRLKSVNCFVKTDAVVPELTRPAVDGWAMDYNAYDKKVNILAPKAMNVTLVAAVYQGEKLISILPVPVASVKNGTVLADVSTLSASDTDTVKLLLWNSLQGAYPLCEAGTIVSGSVN